MLVGDPPAALETRVRLARIGFDRVIGFLADPGELLTQRPDLIEASSRVSIEHLAELVGLLPDLQLVDVRNPGETATGMLSGARAIPLATLADSLAQLDRNAPVVVNCASGYRSVVGASLLSHAGFADVSDLVGGYGAWCAAGLPVVTDGAPAASVVGVTPLAVDDLLRAGATLIDVREPSEWVAGHAPHAVHIPMGQVELRIGEIPRPASAVIVCRSGGRSNSVTQLLTARGVNAVNLVGGMRAWEGAGLPVVTDAGAPGCVA